jgi:DNA-binding transcriptional LysR family regulator
MSIDDWDEIRTAYQVARLGTVSAAAEVLGVHHATVIRHIDALEAALGVRLFQRHPRGYTATEAGQELMQVARVADENFAQMVNRIRGLGDTVNGEIVVTSLPEMSGLLAPILTAYQDAHPNVDLRYVTGDRLFRLEYGEAHVAVRAGASPDQPDNVVQPFLRLNFALYAHESYLARNGRPEGLAEMAQHRFVIQAGRDDRAPFLPWLEKLLPNARLGLVSPDAIVVLDAIAAGAGIGFLTDWQAARLPGVVKLYSDPAHRVGTWLVTLVDLHRTLKVQSLLTALKNAAKDLNLDG